MSFFIELIEAHRFSSLIILCIVIELLGIFRTKLLDKKYDKIEDKGKYFLITGIILLQILLAVAKEMFDWTQITINASPNTEKNPVQTASPTVDKSDDTDDKIADQETIIDLHEIVEYYIKLGSSQVISEEELALLDDEILYLVRNGLFARAGRAFLEEDLRDFYETYEWYEGYVEPQDFKWEMLNSFQSRTIENIRKIEKSRK